MADAMIELAHKCSSKRADLGRKASRQAKWRKLLRVASGILSLLSAASIMSVIAKFTDATGVSVLSAVLASASGIMTLLLEIYYDEKEITRMFEGAAKFLAIKDEALFTRARLEGSQNRAQLHKEYHRLEQDYNQASREYDHLIGITSYVLYDPLPVTFGDEEPSFSLQTIGSELHTKPIEPGSVPRGQPVKSGSAPSDK